MEKKILVLLDLEPKHREYLESQAPQCQFIYKLKKDLQPGDLADVEIIIGNPPLDQLAEAKKLQWIQLETAGSDTYSKEGVLPQGALLTNATGAYGLAISEYMLGVLLGVYKNLYRYWDNQKAGLWKDEGKVKSIEGATVLIIGLGDIGSTFGKKMKALGAYVIGVRRKGTEKPDYVDELYLEDQIDALLPRADVVALSLPATAATYHLMDERRLELMKSDAVLINVGRGNAIDTEALVKALKSKTIMAACLDVTDPEPLPSNHPLWSLDNAIITPHVSGGDHLQETVERIIGICGRNLKAFLAGQPMENVVDLTTGYRKLKESQ